MEQCMLVPYERFLSSPLILLNAVVAHIIWRWITDRFGTALLNYLWSIHLLIDNIGGTNILKNKVVKPLSYRTPQHFLKYLYEPRRWDRQVVPKRL